MNHHSHKYKHFLSRRSAPTSRASRLFTRFNRVPRTPQARRETQTDRPPAACSCSKCVPFRPDSTCTNLAPGTDCANPAVRDCKDMDSSPPLGRTYLDKATVQAHLQAVERSPDSHEYLYRRVMMAVLRHFFTEHEGFDVFQQESRGEINEAESRADMAVLKITAPPGGSMHAYDYCLVASKRAGRSWSDTQDHLRKHCVGTDNISGQVYGMVHSGLHVQFFTADRGVLAALSGGLHIRNDVTQVTAMLESMKRRPLPFI